MTCESSCELARKLKQMFEPQTVVCFQPPYASTQTNRLFPGSSYSNILLKKITSANVTGRSQMSDVEVECSQIKAGCFLIYKLAAL